MYVWDDHRPRITKRQLRKARPENVRRLARWLRVRNMDKMSDAQLIRFLDWLFKRQIHNDFVGHSSPW